MPELLTEQQKALYFKRMADSKNLESLSEVFEYISKAAAGGEYEIDIEKELSAIEGDVLVERGFDITWYDDGDDEYQEGFRTYISWEDVDGESAE